jgi:hypothetical protein
LRTAGPGDRCCIFGMALFAMLLCSFVTGVFFGYLIWGV